MDPIIKEDYVIITCPCCNGSGKEIIIPKEVLPPMERDCPACLSIRLVRIPINAIPILKITDK